MNKTMAHKIIRNNNRLIIRQVANDARTSYSSYRDILTDLGTSRTAAKFVSRLLIDEQ